MFLSDLSFLKCSIFYLFQTAMTKSFALVSLYVLDFAIQVILGNRIFLVFGILQISHLPDVGNFLQNLC